MTQKQSKALNIALWTAQGFLAITFSFAGLIKIVQPDALPFPWVGENPTLVLITGIVDLLAGIGILFPAWLHIKPKLTLFAAYGIIVMMIAASVFNISRDEAKDIGFNLFTAFFAFFIAWGRQTKAPLVSK